MACRSVRALIPRGIDSNITCSSHYTKTSHTKSIYPSKHSAIHSIVYPPPAQPACLPACPSVHLSVCMSCSSIGLSVHPSSTVNVLMLEKAFGGVRSEVSSTCQRWLPKFARSMTRAPCSSRTQSVFFCVNRAFLDR
jgi:hypothetical protein